MRLLKDIRVSDGHRPTPLAGTSANQWLEPSVSQADDSGTSAYPGHILDTAIQCRLQPQGDNTGSFHILWRQVLAYWFPPPEGYKVAEEWQPAFPEPNRSLASIAILFQEQPIVLLRLQGVSDSHRGLTQRSMRATADKVFDTVAIWSGQPAICVISAMAAKWSMFVRPTEMTSAMVQDLVGYDWYGDFGDDVWSTTSYQALGQYFKVLKASCKWPRP